MRGMKKQTVYMPPVLYDLLNMEARSVDVGIGGLLIGHTLAYLINSAFERGDLAAARRVWEVWQSFEQGSAPHIQWDLLESEASE